MAFTWLRRTRVNDDDVDESIIDVLNRVPAAKWQHAQPLPRMQPDPPSREDRRELHITGPQRQRPYLNGVVVGRPSFGARLRQSRDMLPLFHQTAKVMGWRGLIPPPKPAVTRTAAMRAIEAHSDKTVRVICQQYGQARSELWERARDYDMREAEYRARRPLAITRGM